MTEIVSFPTEKETHSLEGELTSGSGGLLPLIAKLVSLAGKHQEILSQGPMPHCL